MFIQSVRNHFICNFLKTSYTTFGYSTNDMWIYTSKNDTFGIKQTKLSFFFYLYSYFLNFFLHGFRLTCSTSQIKMG